MCQAPPRSANGVNWWIPVADPGAHRVHTPTGPNSIILTHKFYETFGVSNPLRGWYPSTGNPGSATGYAKCISQSVVVSNMKEP